ncbi:MAG: purine-nucleoside phosphorylase [Cytophagaceae bacterium]|nr:purine-nucleoside phosphorylase [Cytophagaceae bacterium]MDW8455483.1 purine-nucleoside phosphorylase [Cytophagaceae bacterium]
MLNEVSRIEEAHSFIRKQVNDEDFEVGIILGSGLGSLVEEMKLWVSIPCAQIPNLYHSYVEGHAGCMALGEMCRKKVMIMQGRYHYYDGFTMTEIVRPVRLMKYCGVKTLIVTNAAGAINRNFKPGDLMVIKDHINFTGINPLRGQEANDFGPRFPDMTYAYDPELISKLHMASRTSGIETKEGVYFFTCGPSYETPAEIKMASILGADAVGMSTVPEVIAAIQAGLKVAGISVLTNMASGITPEILSHDKVIEVTKHASERFKKLLIEFLKLI